MSLFINASLPKHLSRLYQVILRRPAATDAQQHQHALQCFILTPKSNPPDDACAWNMQLAQGAFFALASVKWRVVMFIGPEHA